MKKILMSAAVLLAGFSVSLFGQNNTVFVNTMIGTNGMGHTFPGVCYPYGAVQLSPDTDTIPHNINGVYQPRVYDYCAGYQYRDSSIVGFSHTHFSGTGHSDLGDILIMPYSGKTQLNPGTREHPDGGYRQRFHHETEVSRPGYYAVTLDDDSIRCELTATPHCGVHRYIFRHGTKQAIVLDLGHGLYDYDGKTLWAECNVNNSTHLVGSRVSSGWSRMNETHFAIRFSKRIKHFGCKDFQSVGYKGFWNQFDVEHDFPEMAGRKLVCWFEFENDGCDTLEVVVSLSAVDRLNAQEQLCHRSFDFDMAREKAENTWQQRLDNFSLEGPEDAKTMFYTSLYHTLINPSLYQDEDGRYRGIDHQIHQNSKGITNYTVFSLWDTYRAFHPLINLLDTALSRDIFYSMYQHYRQSPHHMLPVWSHNGTENWCMIGYHGVSVVLDALLHNRWLTKDDYGLQAGWAVLSTSNVDYYDHTDLYKRMGYVPVDLNSNGTSITLENAYEDWCIYYAFPRLEYPFPDFSGYEDSVRESYRQRALSYRNVYDTAIGFVRGRLNDGSWKTPYSLLSTSGEGLIEGNAWNYSFYVPHDVNGMMQLMGGEPEFVKKLDTLFTMYIPDEFFAATEDVTREGMLGGYVQGNEPSHHIPYLYVWTSQPWKTQYWVREIMNKMYRNHIDGLCGNDDCGQMSAWYIFSAMGFYPVCPGSGEYVIGAPYLPYMKVRLGNGRYLEIKAPKVSDRNRYIQQVKWNGKIYEKSFLTYDQLMEGGMLEFIMGSAPNKKLFQSKESKPYSLTNH